MIFLSISALLSHWRKKPFQMVFMLLSLSVASALWSGVAIINEQARNSYNKAGYETMRMSVLENLSMDSFIE